MGALHAVQAILVLILATDFTLPIGASYPEGPPGTPAGDTTVIFDLSIAWGVAVFLFLSAFFHWLIASPGVYPRYRAGLDAGRNYFRWVEYSLSSSVMIVLIAVLPGILDLAALVALFGVNASMIFFGAEGVLEGTGFGMLQKHSGRLWHAANSWLGSLAGNVPWIAIGIYLFSPGSDAQPPGFVYGIFFSLFVFFNTFAINMWLQYRQVGKWSNYLYGERAYMILSLVAKSLLSWQVFGGTLAG